MIKSFQVIWTQLNSRNLKLNNLTMGHIGVAMYIIYHVTIFNDAVFTKFTVGAD